MKGLHQGERLNILANRSGISKAEIAKQLNVHPGHLSKLFKSELLTSKVRKSAAALFGVDESYFDGDASLDQLEYVNESAPEYRTIDFDSLTASNILRYLEEKDKRHYEERARLLIIIENLTKPK